MSRGAVGELTTYYLLHIFIIIIIIMFIVIINNAKIVDIRGVTNQQ